MLGFQDFTTNSYPSAGLDYNPLMTTALLSDLYSPYSYGTIAGATPASNANNANTYLDEVYSLLSEAWGILPGAGTSVTAPAGNFPSPNTPTAGNVGVGHQTGDPEVDSFLNQIDGFVADTKSWLGSLFKDPLTGMLMNSQSTLPLTESSGQDVSTIVNPNTTDAQLNPIDRQNQYTAQIERNRAKLEEMKNSINKGDQRLNNKHRFDSYNTFNTGPVYGLDGETWIGYVGLDGSYTRL
ncbi:MAG: hypothetical protein U7126_29025 [Microcoleus sp.]